MKRTNRLMLIFGAIMAAVAFVVVLALGSGQKPPVVVPADVPVVVASQNVTMGTPLTAEMLATENRTPTDALGTYQNPAELVGLVVRRAVTQGAALTNDDFQTGISVPELVSSLQPGMRAVAVPLSRVDSVGALLQAGDWVDVILSITDLDALNPVVIANPFPAGTGTDGGAGAPYISLDDFINNTTVKVVVQNVQVLAALPRSLGVASDAVGPNGVLEPDLIAILAVQPQQAEVIRFAQLDGHISLALRAPADYAAGQVQTTGITLRELVDRWGVLPPLPVTP